MIPPPSTTFDNTSPEAGFDARNVSPCETRTTRFSGGTGRNRGDRAFVYRRVTQMGEDHAIWPLSCEIRR